MLFRRFGDLWKALERTLLELLGAFLGSYGSSGMLPGSHLGDLGGCWTHLGASWSALGASSKGLGSLLGASEEHFGGILELFGDDFGAWTADSKRFVNILKNLEKRCKVLQKSRFRGSEIYEKISLEGNLKPKLVLSWLVKVQVGAKRGKLTSNWRLRGTKLELKRALGAPKEAPRRLKRASWSRLGASWRGLGSFGEPLRSILETF